ncbi:PGBD5 [Cordylochernes scorpioides]|uniref:PGBD5 n=1 Tax=Cordylochernes scorpioides TaxID=51811 RepID=A0ABY6KCF8_9ARAC|nr:PGBD5 [Cordylochernes scorpioides]
MPSESRITVGNLPFFVADAAMVDALSRYGRITSIAPKLLKTGEFTYTDGRREALLLLHDGITIDKLPTRFEIRIKGEAWPAFLSHGIKCSKCHGQGHRRANCPQLHGRSTTARRASPTSHLRPRCLGGLQLRLLRQRLPPSTPVPPASSAQAEAPAPTSATPAPENPVDPRSAASNNPEPMPPARPDLIAPRGPGDPRLATLTPDVEMTEVDRNTASFVSSSKENTRDDLVVFLRRNPGVSFAGTDALGLGRKEVLDLLSSKTRAQRKRPLLTPPQSNALAGLINRILDLKSEGNSNIYKVLGQVKAELKTTPAAVPPTPALPAPRPAKPTTPAPQKKKSTPAMATPSPPPSAHTEIPIQCLWPERSMMRSWEQRHSPNPNMPNSVLSESPGSAEIVPERPSCPSQTGDEISPKIALQKNISEESLEKANHANSPAGNMHVNLAAARDVTAPKTAASSSENLANPASLNWADSEMAEADDSEGFIVVKKGKKRRLGSTSPEHAARQPNKPGEQRGSQQHKRPTGPRKVPPQEIKATRKDIAEAKARQNSSTHENYIFVERRMNGHYLVGLATKDPARRLVEGGLEIEGTTLRVFPYRKRAERIIVANLPGFVEDSAVVNALSPYGKVTSIAPILVKMGEFTFTDGRREAFILLNDGTKLDRLPTRLDVKSKGDSVPAFLSFGIKCSKCGKQGHRRANCPALARQTISSRQTASPTDARPPSPPPPPQQPRQPSPAPAAPASPVPPAETSTEATAIPSAPQPAEPKNHAQPAPAAHPAPLAPPRPPGARTPLLDCVVTNVEEPSTSSTSSQKRTGRAQLEKHLDGLPTLPIVQSVLQDLGRAKTLDLLSSRKMLKKDLASLPAAQVASLLELINTILAAHPDTDSIVQRETNAYHLDSCQDLCLGYNTVVLTHPVAIPGSGLACVFGPGVAVLRQRVLWPGHIALAVIDVHGEEMTIINAHLAHDPRERREQLELLAATELELLRKIHSLQHMDKLFKDHVFVIVNFDDGGWNNLFRMAVCEPVLRQVHEAVMGTEAFSKSQYPFQAALFYIADQDIFIQWDGQDGGVEGHLQLDWMEIYYGQIQAAFHGLPVVVRIIVKGDDLRAIIGIPQYSGGCEPWNQGQFHSRPEQEETQRLGEFAYSGCTFLLYQRYQGRSQSLAGWAPRAQEIRTTRAHIVEARARQASSSEEHCVYVEHSPELQPFHYLRAIDRMVGGASGVVQISKINGHYLLGLANRGLAERLISEGLEVEGTHLRAFPFGKRAVRITVGNLPFFVGDSAIISALTPYGRVTSIAPKLMKAGPYIYTDRREAFIALHEGVSIDPPRHNNQRRGLARIPDLRDQVFQIPDWPHQPLPLASNHRLRLGCLSSHRPSLQHRRPSCGPSCAPSICCTSAIPTSAPASPMEEATPAPSLQTPEDPAGPCSTASWHPEPTPPAPQGEESTLAMMTPPPPLALELEEWTTEIFEELDYQICLRPLIESGIDPSDLVDAVLFSEDRVFLLAKLSPGMKKILAEFLNVAIEQAQDYHPEVRTDLSRLRNDDWIETTTSTIPRLLFTAQPGPRAELFPEPNSPYQIFKKFIDEDFFGNLKLETNRYARATIDRERKKDPLNPRSHLEMWKAFSVSELKIFMAIIIHMSLVVKTRLKDYWSTRSELRTTYCRDVGMIRPRFEAILSMLHLNDNASYVAFGQPGHDPLHKIRTFLDALVHKFKTYYYPCQPLTIDEAICPFRGRIRFRIYIKGKPHKYGIKIFELCESSSGYACNIEVYTGKQPGQGADYNSTLKLVERMAAPYFNRGHVIYFDRWCSIYYNKHKAGVDRSDQLLSYYSFQRRTMKWWKKLFFHIFGLTIVNSHIIYNKLNPTSKLSLRDYHLVIMEKMVEEAGVEITDQQLGSSSSKARLLERHFITRIKEENKPNVNIQRKCKVCAEKRKSATGKRIRKDTAYIVPTTANYPIQFFLDTLGISEGLIKGAFRKLSPTGILEPDRRGGKRLKKELGADGHSHMECDSIHSKIEIKSKNSPVYTLEGWAQIIRLARSKPSPFEITELVHDDFLNFNTRETKFEAIKEKGKQNYKINEKGTQIKFTDAVWYQYRKEENKNIFMKTEIDGDYLTLISKQRKGKQSTTPVTPYKERLPISDVKKKRPFIIMRPKFNSKADCSEDLRPGADDGFTVVKSRKRRRESAGSPTAAAPSSNIGGARNNHRAQSSAGSVPRAQEITTTRAHIVEARARQASSSEEHCVYLEHGPEQQPFHYLRALDRLLGGTARVIQISKVNGHQLLGLANRGLAERLITEGLEVEGTLLRAFHFRKRAERITVGNLPFFVEDSAIINALKPYGRITSIAPKMKAGPYIYSDGRREAFIVLRDGVTTERLPARLKITIKGEAWPAYLSSGIKCSRCHGQGHRRANCPLLAGRVNTTRSAPPASPAGVPPSTAPAPLLRPPSQHPAPEPPLEISGASLAARAATYPVGAPQPSPTAPPALPTEEAPPAPPPVTPAPSSQAPRDPAGQPTQEILRPANTTHDVEMTTVEESISSSASSVGKSTRSDLVAFIKGSSSVSFAGTDALGLGREEVLNLLSSKTKAQKRGHHLTPPQSNALADLINQILDLRPGGNTNIYKVLGQVRTMKAVYGDKCLSQNRIFGWVRKFKSSIESLDNAPPLPTPRLAEPTPPAPQENESTPTMATPPPPSAHMEDNPTRTSWKMSQVLHREFMKEPDLGPTSQSGIDHLDLVDATSMVNSWRVWKGFFGWNTLVEETYLRLTASGASFAKRISPGTFAYYVGLQAIARVLELSDLSPRGTTVPGRDLIRAMKHAGTHFPERISLFLSGLGDAASLGGVKYIFTMPSLEYAVANNNTPGLAASRIMAELGNVNGRWPLPADMNPLEEGAGLPTQNIVGYGQVEPLEPAAHMPFLVPAGSPGSADVVPERPSNVSQSGEEISPENRLQKKASEEKSKNQNHANSPAGVKHVNLAAERDVTAPTNAASSSANSANPAWRSWGDTEMAEVESNDGYTLVRNKKRRLGSPSSEHAPRQPNKPGEQRGSQQHKRPTGPRKVPPQEIKAKRKNIAEAKARQNSSTHENYIFVELCPEIPDYTYLKAMSKLVGGPNNITQFNRMNGHYIVGLASMDLASRLVVDGLEIEGTSLKVFPFRKRAERIVVANLPGFVEDFTVVNALSPYGRVTSIAPILVKMEEFTFTDGRREAFILLNDGIKLDRLPTRLDVKSKGDSVPAFLSFGIKCSKCGKRGHRRANCPALARQGNGSPRQAASPTDARPPPLLLLLLSGQGSRHLRPQHI